MTELERIQRDIARAEEALKKAEQERKAAEQQRKQLKRKERNHRIFTYGGVVESCLKEPTLMTEADVKDLLEVAFQSQAVRTRENILLERKKAAMTRAEEAANETE